jgi:ADP-ribosyl-[dinitrogen reductase] hydrolase
MAETPIAISNGDEAAQGPFVGRETECNVFASTLMELSTPFRRSLWRKALDWVMERKQPIEKHHRVFLLYGEGGMGKSRLIWEYHKLCQKHPQVLWIEVNWGLERDKGLLPRDLENLMKRLYNALIGPKGERAEYFQAYRDALGARKKLDEDIETRYQPEARQEFDKLVSVGTRPLAVATHAVTGFPAQAVQGGLSEVVHTGASAVAAFRDFLDDWLDKRLDSEKNRLYFNLGEELAEKLVEGILNLTNRYAVVIAFDGWDLIVQTPELDRLFRTRLIRPCVTRSDIIAFVLAGRVSTQIAKLYRLTFRGAELFRDFEMLPLKKDDIGHYLEALDLPTAYVDVVQRKTRGIPIALQAVASMLSKGASIERLFPDQQDPSLPIDDADVTRIITENFLLYCQPWPGDPDELLAQKRRDRRCIYTLALLRYYDLGALQAMWDETDHKAVEQTLAQLWRTYPFIFTGTQRRMHELVREFVRAYLRNNTGQPGFLDWDEIQLLNERARNHFQRQLAQIEENLPEGEDRYADINWQNCTLNLLNHLLWLDEKAAKEFLVRQLVTAAMQYHLYSFREDLFVVTQEAPLNGLGPKTRHFIRTLEIDTAGYWAHPGINVDETISLLHELPGMSTRGERRQRIAAQIGQVEMEVELREVEGRYVGCLLGMAIGDALGMPVEFLGPEDIRRRFGRVTDFLPMPESRSGHHLQAGQYTDDTSLMLRTVESIIEKEDIEPEDIAMRFVKWFASADRSKRRAGRTTSQAIMSLIKGVHWQASGIVGTEASNGSVMRIAPIGLANLYDLETLAEDAKTISTITHAHPEAVAACRAISFAIALLAAVGCDVNKLLDRTVQFVHGTTVAERLLRVKELLSMDIPTEAALAELGTKSNAIQTTASAFFCFLKAPNNFEEAVISAVMGGYDTDTTAAVTGSLSGAHVGMAGIPRRWVERVENSEYIQRLGRQLYRLVESRRL